MKKSELIDCFQVGGREEALSYVVDQFSLKNLDRRGVQSIGRSVDRCVGEWRNLKKSVHRTKGKLAYDEFMSSTFTLSQKRKKASTSSPKKPPASTSFPLKPSSSTSSLKKPSPSTSSPKKHSASTTTRVRKKADQLKSFEIREEQHRRTIKQLRARLAYSQSKVLRLEKEAENDEVVGLKHQVKELQTNCRYLESLLHDDKNVVLFNEEEKTFTPDCQLCVYELLDCNVSASRVGDVIRTCCRLAGKEVARVPSKSTVLRMDLQRLNIAQQQIAE